MTVIAIGITQDLKRLRLTREADKKRDFVD
jgi:hypothetical protein